MIVDKNTMSFVDEIIYNSSLSSEEQISALEDLGDYEVGNALNWAEMQGGSAQGTIDLFSSIFQQHFQEPSW